MREPAAKNLRQALDLRPCRPREHHGDSPAATGAHRCRVLDRVRASRLRPAQRGDRTVTVIGDEPVSADLGRLPEFTLVVGEHPLFHALLGGGRTARPDDHLHTSAARNLALTEVAQTTPLAARPYNLRHATVSTWLTCGQTPATVTEWAGISCPC
jgi:hypothetical protein